MNIGEYCKEYRKKQGVKLKELTNGGQIKTLSNFENGNSFTIGHLLVYIELSISLQDEQAFMLGLIELVKDGKKQNNRSNGNTDGEN